MTHENHWQDRRVLVTGSAGVIGREVLALLGSMGARVLSVDRLALPPGEWTGCTHLRLDLAEDDLAQLVEFSPQTVIHLAAAFERSKESPGFWPVNWHDNMTCSHRVIETCQRCDALHAFIFASSYLVYDPQLYLRADAPTAATVLAEDDRKDTRNITGAAKLYTENELAFLREYFRASLRVVNARIYRVYGRGSKDVVSRWVRAALAGEPVSMYNAENLFDYVFAGDVAAGLVRLAASEAAGPVNLARGEARTVRDVVQAIDVHVPGFASLVRDEGTHDEFEASCADLSRLSQTTAWRPPTDLAEGIRLVVEYERGQLLTGGDPS